MPIHGIDVSRWQGKIDWASVHGAGTQFAFIKATEGGDHVDPRFLENWHGAAEAGVPRGAYHFMYWCRPAHEQAAWFKPQRPERSEALPPVLDLEWNGHSRTCPFKATRETALEHIKLMLRRWRRIRASGRSSIPTSPSTARCSRASCPIIRTGCAASPPSPTSATEPQWTMWQYTTTGRVPGIEGDVDRNAFYGGDQEWATFLATNCDPRQFRQLAARGSCTGTSAWAQK